jgi:hypothetical protein
MPSEEFDYDRLHPCNFPAKEPIPGWVSEDDPVLGSDPELIWKLLNFDAGDRAIDAARVARMGHGVHITRVAYFAARPFRAEREGEWLPEELCEPMKSMTGRSPINWDI